MTRNSILKTDWRSLLPPRRMKIAVMVATVILLTLLARLWQVEQTRQKLREPLILGIWLPIFCKIPSALSRSDWIYRKSGTLSILAARAGDYQHVEALLKQGADPNSRWPVDVSLKERIEDWIDSIGQPSHSQDLADWYEDTETALVAATEKGNTQVVKLLILYGADINLRCTYLTTEGTDYRRRTALEQAEYNHYTEIELIMEQAGAIKSKQ